MRLLILDDSADPTRDDEDVVRHECRARDSRVIGVAESPFFLVVLRVTYYVHEIAKPNMHELKHSTVQCSSEFSGAIIHANKYLKK